MGLCKCPQRKVSTLFCFKHHVNVCESCLVNEHSQCIVRSYVSWLQDNDYNPNCALCQRSLSETDEETIRLICYDLFHWSCLNEYFRSFPNHTAPDGYVCPTCHTCVFPPLNLVSPVADQVRNKLSTVNWANRLPILSSNEININQDKQQLLTETENNGYVIVNPTVSANIGGHLSGASGLSHHPHRSNDMSQTTTILPIRSLPTDSDEDKYKRRSVFTWFARWLRSRQATKRKGATINNRMSRTRFTIYMILIILFVFITIVTVLYHFTRGDNNEQLERINDPQFNPLNNPFIRVGNRLFKNPSKDSGISLNKDQLQ